MAGLTTSLLTVDQFCDDVADEVYFSKKCCKVVDKNGKILLVVPRSEENCCSLVIPKGGMCLDWNKRN